MKILDHHGLQIRMGRNRPSPETAARPHLRLAKYFMPEALPSVPAATGARYEKTMDVVSRMYGNDKYGCCTKSGQAHLIGFFTGVANPPATVFTDQQVIDDYMRLTGGQDIGLDEVTVLEDWRDNTSAPLGPQHNIDGFASVDASNVASVKFAIDAFPNAYLGLELPDAYVNPFPAASGFTWDVAGAPDPENGHAIIASDYTEQGIIVWTWGMWGTMTWEAVGKYLTAVAGGAFYVLLTEEAVSKAEQKTPSGFDFTQLKTDMAQYYNA